MTAPDRSEEFARHYESVAPALHAWAVLQCRGPLGRAIEPEDLVQESCIQAFGAFERFDATLGSFHAWMFGVATRVASSALRRMARRHALGRQRTLDDLTREPLGQVTTISRRVRRDEALERFLAATRELEEEERELLVHRGLEGLPHEEVAALLGLSVDAATKRWHRLREKLRALPAVHGLLQDV